jgi:inward rectifier potassium channel
MQNEIKDPGFGTGFKHKTKRIVNPDGSFNIYRKGAYIKWKDAYKYLIEISWAKFFIVLFSFYIFLNLIFTCFYWLAGFNNITGIDPSKGPEFIQAYYFSVQTFTTVGYGVMSPTGMLTQLISSVEAFVGFLSFSLATGLLYGRFSKPNSKIIFSKNAIVTPYKNDILSLQVKIVNARDGVLLDVSASLILAVDDIHQDGSIKKSYFNLPLERQNLKLLPLSWTIVHPIDSNSPLFKLSKEKILNLNHEVIVIVKGFDEVFSQEIISKTSYIASEWVWGKKFKRIFSSNNEGVIELNVNEINELENL